MTLVKKKRTETVDNSNFKSKYSPELIEINYSLNSGELHCVTTAKRETEGTQEKVRKIL